MQRRPDTTIQGIARMAQSGWRDPLRVPKHRRGGGRVRIDLRVDPRDAGRSGNKDSVIHGVSRPFQAMGVVSQSVSPARKQMELRALAIARGSMMGVPLTIPGTKEDLGTIRKGDPLFTMVEWAESGHSKKSLVFTALNGLPISGCKTSTDMDRKIMFVGYAAEGFQLGDISRELMDITADVCTQRTVVNTGPSPLWPGDRVCYITPFWDSTNYAPMLALTSPGVAPVAGDRPRYPDGGWVASVSGHPKSTRVVPHLTKVTPEMITETSRHVFNRLFVNAVTGSLGGGAAKTSIYPVLPLCTAPTEAGRRDMSTREGNLDGDDILAGTRYASIGASAWHAIDLLVSEGILTFGPSTRTRSHVKNMDLVADMLGLYQTRLRGEEEKADPRREIAKQRLRIVKQMLFRTFYPFITPTLKSQTSAEIAKHQIMAGGHRDMYEPAMIAGLLETGRASERYAHMKMLSATQLLVGRVTMGGMPGEELVVVSRPGM